MQSSSSKALPLCTIVMATYNRPKLVGTAIRSVLAQTYPNIELCLVNDGGSDILALVDEFHDPRIRYFPLPVNLGAAHAYNYAIYQSQGEYIGYVADDDLLYPNHVETLVDALQNHPEVGAAYSDQYHVSCEMGEGAYTKILGKQVTYSVDFDRMQMISGANFIPHPCLIHRRGLFQQAGYYDEKLVCLIDWDLFRRMAFFSGFLHVKVITGEYFVPLNKKERLSDLKKLDESKFYACQDRVFSKRPPGPWKGMSEIKFVIYHDSLDVKFLEQLKMVLRLVHLPLRIFLVMDFVEERLRPLLKEIREVEEVTLVLNIEPMGLKKTLLKCLTTYFRSDDWLFAIDKNVVLSEEWGRGFMAILKNVFESRYQQPKTFKTNCLYTDITQIASALV